MKRGEIFQYRSMDAGGSPDTAGWQLERWSETVCNYVRAADFTLLEMQRLPVGNDGHAILIWRSGRLVAQGLLIRTALNWAHATGVVLEDLV